MLEIAAIVDIGKSRDINDDRLLINSLVWDEGKMRVFLDGGMNILAVADGVGGSPEGGMAAEITLKTIISTEPTAEALAKAIQQANSNICEYAKDNPEASGLSTTLAGVLTKDDDTITVFNVGDSRVYRYRQGILYLLTKDHSVIGPLIDMGLLSPEDAKNHENRSVITRCVGIRDMCLPDIEEDISFLDDDILLICSDGLSDYVEREVISEALKKNDLNQAADELVKMANEKGGYDNISVLLAKKTKGGAE